MRKEYYAVCSMQAGLEISRYTDIDILTFVHLLKKRKETLLRDVKTVVVF